MQKCKLILIITFTMLIFSCSETRVINARWSGAGEAPKLPKSFLLSSAQLKMGTTQIQFQQQKIGGALVEGTSYKKITESGVDKFISFIWIDKVSFDLRTDIALMNTEKSLVLRQFLLTNPSFKSLKIYEHPKIIVRFPTRPQLFWKMSFEHADGKLSGIYLDRKFQVVERLNMGSEFVDATAYLYPQGPLRSELSAVILQKISNEGILRSDDIQVTTQGELIAKAEKNQFLYPVHDNRFRQVQVYFYLAMTKQWFLNQFQFKLPFILSAETFVGFPDKTNTAFYYQQKIRLGEGDGLIFSDIALDPSIVVHESVHAVIQAVAALTYTGEGGSLNEGFADFFTAMILDNPKLGEVSYKKATFKRTVENNLHRNDFNMGLYHDAGIISGLLWSMHKSIGKDKTTRFAWKILIRLDGTSTFDSFATELLEELKKLDPLDQENITIILKQRGWSK